MLPKKQRLSRAQFAKVFDTSTVLHSGHFSMKWTDDLLNKESQFAIVVSKKVSRSSVGRNSIRRRCYGVLEKLLLQISENATGIIFVRPSAVHLPPKALEEELRGLFLRAGIVPKV